MVRSRATWVLRSPCSRRTGSSGRPPVAPAFRLAWSPSRTATVSRRAALALGATVLVIVVGVATYLVLSERSSQQRVDAAVAGLDLAGDGATLADELSDTATQAPRRRPRRGFAG